MSEQRDQIFDLAFLFEFTEGDAIEMQRFIQKFMDNFPKEEAKIESSLAEGNRDALYLTVHGFRPQLEFVGLKVAAVQLLEIERGARDGMSFEHMSSLFGQVKGQLNALPPATEWIY